MLNSTVADSLIRKWDEMTLIFSHSSLCQIPAMFNAERLNRQPEPPGEEGTTTKRRRE
jgi:hypothetical protein